MTSLFEICPVLGVKCEYAAVAAKNPNHMYGCRVAVEADWQAQRLYHYEQDPTITDAEFVQLEAEFGEQLVFLAGRTNEECRSRPAA